MLAPHNEAPKMEVNKIVNDLKDLQKRYTSSLSPHLLDSKFDTLIKDLELILKELKC